MELKVKLVLVALVVALLHNVNVDARLDQSTSWVLGSSNIKPYNFVRDGNEVDCCKNCVQQPIRIYPPRYKCMDIAESCPTNCKSCICTRSIPPQCRCTDTLIGSCDSLCKGECGHEIKYLA